MRKFVVVSLMGLSLNISASEVDHFTDRYGPLADSYHVIQSKAEELLDKALAEANEKSFFSRVFGGKRKCSEKKLYKSMREYFRNHVQGKEFAQFVMHSEEIARRPTVLKESIYGDFTPVDAYTIALAKVYKDTAGSVINFNGVQVGSDKFEHFMGQGFIYFKKYHLKKSHDLNELLDYGHFTERYLLGSRTTGVYSHGDLTANLTGMRFWNHLLQKEDDVLGAEFNWGPYVVCENGRWIKNKKEDQLYTFDLGRYINVGFDEGNNCARFRKKSIMMKVLKRISSLESEDKDGRSYSCPIEPEKIDAVKEMWGPIIGPRIINNGGHYYLKR